MNFTWLRGGNFFQMHSAPDASAYQPADAGGPAVGGQEWGTTVPAGTTPAAAPGKRRTAVLVSEVLLSITYVLVLALAGVVIWQLAERHSERHVVAWAVAAIFVGIATPLSLHAIHLHLLHYQSDLQKYYIRILAMVPIYAIESWCALRWKDQVVYFATAREAYEAFVIHSFFSLLMAFLGPRETLLRRLAARAEATGSATAHMLPPFNLVLRPWRLDGEFIDRARRGVFQYVALRTSLAVAILICEHYDAYGEGEWSNPRKLYVYAVVTLNLSQVWAMYCLVLLYHELLGDLAPLRPLPKFLSVKAVVFFSFWQSILLSGLVHAGVIQPTLTYTEEEVAQGLQNFIICIEMAAAAVAHHMFFAVSDFWREDALAPLVAASGGAGPRPLVHAVLDVLPHDVIAEAGGHLKAAVAVARRAPRPAAKSDVIGVTTPGASPQATSSSPGSAPSAPPAPAQDPAA